MFALGFRFVRLGVVGAGYRILEYVEGLRCRIEGFGLSVYAVGLGIRGCRVSSLKGMHNNP